MVEVGALPWSPRSSPPPQDQCRAGAEQTPPTVPSHAAAPSRSTPVWSVDFASLAHARTPLGLGHGRRRRVDRRSVTADAVTRPQ